MRRKNKVEEDKERTKQQRNGAEELKRKHEELKGMETEQATEYRRLIQANNYTLMGRRVFSRRRDSWWKRIRS